MDDGGLSVYNQTILHTRAFKLEDVKYIQFVLLENFGLTTRLEEKKKDKWVIYIPVRQKTKLKDIVDLLFMKVCYIRLNKIYTIYAIYNKHIIFTWWDN